MNVSGRGDQYFAVCSDHLAKWRDLNDMLKAMNIKSVIRPLSEIKYSKMNM
jgi:hypothetical protein